jgi:hypothetical protein
MSVETIPRTSTFTGTTFATNGSPVQDNEIARTDIIYTFAYFFYNSRGFVTEKKRKLVTDSAFAKM